MEDSKLPSTRLTGWKKAGEERKLTIRVSFLLIIRESFLIV
jgi:hypothetical protein